MSEALELIQALKVWSYWGVIYFVLCGVLDAYKAVLSIF